MNDLSLQLGLVSACLEGTGCPWEGRSGHFLRAELSCRLRKAGLPLGDTPSLLPCAVGCVQAARHSADLTSLTCAQFTGHLTGSSFALSVN